MTLNNCSQNKSKTVKTQPKINQNKCISIKNKPKNPTNKELCDIFETYCSKSNISRNTSQNSLFINQSFPSKICLLKEMLAKENKMNENKKENIKFSRRISNKNIYLIQNLDNDTTKNSETIPAIKRCEKRNRDVSKKYFNLENFKNHETTEMEKECKSLENKIKVLKKDLKEMENCLFIMKDIKKNVYFEMMKAKKINYSEKEEKKICNDEQEIKENFNINNLDVEDIKNLKYRINTKNNKKQNYIMENDFKNMCNFNNFKNNTLEKNEKKYNFMDVDFTKSNDYCKVENQHYKNGKKIIERNFESKPKKIKNMNSVNSIKNEFGKKTNSSVTKPFQKSIGTVTCRRKVKALWKSKDLEKGKSKCGSILNTSLISEGTLVSSSFVNDCSSLNYMEGSFYIDNSQSLSNKSTKNINDFSNNASSFPNEDNQNNFFKKLWHTFKLNIKAKKTFINKYSKMILKNKDNSSVSHYFTATENKTLSNQRIK